MRFSHSIIIDTDIGGDPDDTFALLLAAFLRSDLRLVITTDEAAGERARFTRHLLDLAGREDVATYEGPILGPAESFVIEDLAPSSIPRQSSGVVPAIIKLLNESAALTWVGLGPATNLARFIDVADSEQLRRCKVYQMGGGLHVPPKPKAEHNFRIDPHSASQIVAKLPQLNVVMEHVTFNPSAEILQHSEFFGRISSSPRPWARILTQQCSRWFSRFFPGTIQHDPMTLSAALGMTYVQFKEQSISVDSFGHTRADDNGFPVQVSHNADYLGVMKWIQHNLSEHI